MLLHTASIQSKVSQDRVDPIPSGILLAGPAFCHVPRISIYMDIKRSRRSACPGSCFAFQSVSIPLPSLDATITIDTMSASDVESGSVDDNWTASGSYDGGADSSSITSTSTDNRSVVSFHSSVDGYLWRELHGRCLNAMNEIYMMPGDEEEHGRLDMQHKALETCINSLYFGVDRVQRVLAPRDSSTPAILDIGCGSGSWPIAMAKEFPHAEVVGLDLVPPASVGSIPDNCRFEVDDANLPMHHYEKCFDVVHCRAIEPGIRDYESLLYDIAHILRHGGVLLLVGGDLQLYNHDRTPLPQVDEGQPGFTYLQRYFSAIFESSKNLGASSANARALWPDWLASNSNFEDIQTVDIYIPIGPWPERLDQRMTIMTELMRKNCLRLFHSCRPMLIQDGYPENMVDRWLTAAEKELQELKVNAFTKWRFTAASRTSRSWKPRPEPPSAPEPSP